MQTSILTSFLLQIFHTYNEKKRGFSKQKEFADEYGLAYSCLYERLKLGWSIEDALLTPSRKDV